MSSATCPKCCRPVTLPCEAPLTAWVRCPLCQAEYRLQEALEFTPPVLVVLAEPAEQRSTSGATLAGADRPDARDALEAENQSIPDLLIDPTAATTARSESPKWSLAAEEMETRSKTEEDLRPGGNRTMRAWPGQACSSAPASTLPSPADRLRTPTAKRKRQKNPLAELAKFVISGCVGLAIGGGVLVWCLDDPLKMAKWLPAFMVPQHLRSADTTSPTTADQSSENVPAVPQRVAENPPLPKQIDPFADNQPPGHVTETTTSPAATAATTPPAINPRPTAQGPKTGVIYSISDASAALAATNEAAAALNAAEKNQTDDAEIDESRQRFYASLSKLAESVTLLRGEPGDQQAARSAAGEMLRGMFSNQEKLEALGNRAAAEFANAMRTANGIVLAGTVEEVRSLDDQYRTFVRLPGKESPISLITAEKPQVSEGDTVISIGIVVDDPIQNIAGYDGPEERIVWAVLIVKSGVSLPSHDP